VVVLQLGGWARGQHHLTVIRNLVTQDLGFGRILCNDLGNGKWIWDLEHEVS
jgi:hypothetical protein